MNTQLPPSAAPSSAQAPATAPKDKAPSKPVLGKGLASLLPPPATTAAAPAEADGMANKDRHPGIMMCALDDIVPNTYQPRHLFDDSTIDELAQSIRANGLIQPLIVRRGQKGFQLIAGERRWRAAKLAGLKQVPIVIRRTTDQEALELALIENIQREDLNCLDTAAAYQQLAAEFSLTQEQIAQKVGKERATVANYLRLLRLPEKVRNWLKDGTLSFGHGKALAGLDEAAQVEKFAADAIDLRWSVRELETQLQRLKEPKPAEEPPTEAALTPLALRMQNIGKELSQRYSTKVLLKGHERRGKILIEYHSLEDLNRLLDQLQR